MDPSAKPKVSSDHFFFDISAFAIDPTTNHSIHIAMFAIAGTVEDFVIGSRDAATTNAFVYNPGDGSVESRFLRVEIKPSVIALANAVGLFLINWLATVGSIHVTILVTLGKLERNNVIAAGPFSALVAIPTVRSLYISSPPLAGPVGESCDRIPTVLFAV